MKLGGLLLLLCLGVCGSTVYKPNWDSLDSRPLPAWYDEAKIGIFIHWGVFSVPSLGSEWFWSNWNNKNKKVVDYMKHNFKPNFTYAEFAPQFTAEFFDPKQWAAIFKKSGARYVVLTSKHHEGYTLWPSKYSFNWNAMAIGPKRDLVGDLAKAVREQKLHFGLYHSLLEWFHPLYLQDKKNQWKTQDFVKNKIRPEMEELVMQYHPEVIWSDGEWESTDTYWGSTHFLAWLFNESPVKNTVVVNDRWGQGILCKHGSFLTCHDKYNPGKLQSRKWENAMTIDRYSWGFRREAVLDDYLTIEELLRNLVTTVSCGGNLLINVGPTAYGKIEPIFEERLTQLGQWLEVNGEAIYKSHPWTHQNDTLAKDVWYTQRENNVYAIFLYVPNEEKVMLGALDYDQVNSIELLGSKTKVQFEKNLSGSGTLVHFPQITLNDQAKYVFSFKVTVKA